MIHDFWVPAFRMKIDAVPGHQHAPSASRRTASGDYPVVCAELCGLGHSTMRQTAHVVEPQRRSTRGSQKLGQPRGGGGRRRRRRRRRGGRRQDALHAADRLRRLPHARRRRARPATTGPNLDKVLKGKDKAFIQQSIEDPNAEIATGFQAGIMPPNFGQTLQPAQIDALVKYLARGDASEGSAASRASTGR